MVVLVMTLGRRRLDARSSDEDACGVVEVVMLFAAAGV